jgi:uncharacterized protein YndB with AHSA1/START domain
MYSNQIDISRWTVAPLQITLTAMINAAPDVVFQAFSDPEIMCQVFSWVDRVTVVPPAANGTQAVGALRTCMLSNGLVLEEEIVDWQPPHGYTYRGIDATHPFGMRGHVGALSFVSAKHGCQFRWQHYFDHSNVPAMREQMKQSMAAAVKAVQKLR